MDQTAIPPACGTRLLLRKHLFDGSILGWAGAFLIAGVFSLPTECAAQGGLAGSDRQSSGAWARQGAGVLDYVVPSLKADSKKKTGDSASDETDAQDPDAIKSADGDLPTGKKKSTVWQKMTGWAKRDKKASGDGALVRDADGNWTVEGKRSRNHDAQLAYNEAEKLFREEKYAKAASAFKVIERSYKGTIIEEDAIFMRAESEFHANRLPKAQDLYARLLTKFPTTRHLPSAIQRTYDIAYYWLEDTRLKTQGKPPKHSAFTNAVNFFDRSRPVLDTPGRAIEAIETIQTHDPFGPLTDDAVMMAGAAKFIKGDYESAATYYEQVSTDQPKSEHATRALVLASQSYWRSYDGPQYDGQHLNNCERMTKAALARGADLDGEQRDKLERDLRNIRLEEAKREFQTAVDYRRMRRRGAAKYHFESTIEDYADTDWAKRAESELVALEKYEAQQKLPFGERMIARYLNRPATPNEEASAAIAETAPARPAAAEPEPQQAANDADSQIK